MGVLTLCTYDAAVEIESSRLQTDKVGQWEIYLEDWRLLIRAYSVLDIDLPKPQAQVFRLVEFRRLDEIDERNKALIKCGKYVCLPKT